MPITDAVPNRIPLPTGARDANVTPQGFIKILRRAGVHLIRDDGRWYVDPADVDRIIAARQTLGLAADRSRG